MNLQKLTRENLGGRNYRSARTITFTVRGTGVLSKTSIKFLNLDLCNDKDRFIDVHQDLEKIADFFISKGSTYRIRKNSTGGGVFNCKNLSDLIMQKTWNHSGHAALEGCPNRISLTICENSIDEGKNKNVFALIRKKV